MIAADQPTCFPSDVLVAVSSKDDGTMLNRIRGRHVAEVLENRRRFCDQIGVTYDDIVYHVISYKIGRHTSELQSHYDLVCRLLLEKKK